MKVIPSTRHGCELSAPLRKGAGRTATFASLFLAWFLVADPVAGAPGARQLVTRAASGPSATASGPGAIFLGEFPRQQLSDDGRFYVFASGLTNLIPGQSSTGIQVFLYDRALNTLAMVSHAIGSATSGGDKTSFLPTISGDGEWVAFASDSTNLIPGYIPSGAHQIYLWNRGSGTLTLASHKPGQPTAGTNDSRTPSLSHDGRYLVFTSDDPFEFIDPNDAFPEVILYDRVLDTRTLVSHVPGGPDTASADASTAPGASFTWSGLISADGSTVIFNSDATDLVAGGADTNGVDDLFSFDRATGVVTLVTHAAGAPAQAAEGSSGIGVDPHSFRVSADGSHVSYTALSNDLVAGQQGFSFGNVFLYSRATDAATLVSHSINGPAVVSDFTMALLTSMSADGRFLTFQTDSTEIVSGVTNVLGQNIYLFDSDSGATKLISHKPGLPLEAINRTGSGFVTLDGSRVVFDTEQPVSGFTDTNGASDVFVWDALTDSVTLTTSAFSSPTTASSGPTLVIEMSRTGFVAVWHPFSAASNLVADDLNGVGDVFLYSESGPPTIAGLGHSNITATSADLSATVTSESGVVVTGRGFVISSFAMEPDPKLGAPGVTAISVTGSAGPLGATAAGLNPNTLYAYAAYATNVFGTAYTPAGLFATTGSLATTTTGVQSSRNPSNATDAVTFTATVTGSGPTGTVNFKDGAVSVAGCESVPLNPSFAAQCATSALSAGTHSIVAEYSGDANNLASSGSLAGGQLVISPTSVVAGDVRITQFRFRGTNVAGSAAKNEYVEITNGKGVDITIGADGWALAASPGGVLATIPAATVLKAGASRLFTNDDPVQGFAAGPLSNYPAYTPVAPGPAVLVGAGDFQFTGDIADGAGIALFRSGVTRDGSTRIDSVGFSGVADPLFREGAGLAPSSGVAMNGDFAFIRKAPNGAWIDTDNNANDFQIVSTDGASTYTGSPSQLGAPGPRSSQSGRWLALPYTAIEPLASSTAAPNRVADVVSTPKRIEFRFRVTNNTGHAISSIRWRVVKVTDLNAPGYSPGGAQSDIRPVTGTTRTIAPPTSIGVSTVQALALETPPMQAMSGGLNSSLAYALPAPLASGASVDVNMVFEIFKGGSFAFATVVEGRIP